MLLKAAVLGSSLEACAIPIVMLSAIAVAAYSISVALFRWE